MRINEDLEGALEEYLSLLNQAKYFEAHEVLEEAWHPLRLRKQPLSNLVKGLINAAIAFEHKKRGSKNALQKAVKVLVSYERHKHLCKEGIQHYDLFKEALRKIEVLKTTILQHS